MPHHWITNGSNRLEPIINPLAAACSDGYVPTDIHLLSNPGITSVTDAAPTLLKTVVTAAGGYEPTIHTTNLESETDFAGIIAYLNDAIDAAKEADATVAIDITPGRKFWSVISFQAGLRRDVDHLYYILLDEGAFGETYPTIPRTAIRLIDFTEEIDAD